MTENEQRNNEIDKAFNKALLRIGVVMISIQLVMVLGIVQFIDRDDPLFLQLLLGGSGILAIILPLLVFAQVRKAKNERAYLAERNELYDK